MNWAGGVVPGATSTVVFNQNAVLSGSVEVFNLMLLGNEVITINGQVKTDNTNVCQSFMACLGAAVTFTAGSSLTDAGGFVTGIDANASVTIDGASGGLAGAVVNVANMKMGQAPEGSGTLTVAGGTINDSGSAYIGLNGAGIMNVAAGSRVNCNNLTLGFDTGSTGTLNLAGGLVNVATGIYVGTSVVGAPGGVGTANITGGTLTTDMGVSVGAGSTINMAGGTLAAGPDGYGLQIRAGGTVSGHGTINVPVKSVVDNGVLASAGGTLMITGNLMGLGAVQIGAGSTLDLVASRINVPSLQFMGANATLDLVTGVGGSFNIAGFGASDHIVMAGIDAANWNAATDVLTLSEKGVTMGHLNLTGIAQNETFMVSQSAAGSVISLTPVTTGGLIIVSHH